jgi:hypothetical protein
MQACWRQQQARSLSSVLAVYPLSSARPYDVKAEADDAYRTEYDRHGGADDASHRGRFSFPWSLHIGIQ